MRVLNSQLLSSFLQAAGRELKGEWLLVGGTLLPAVGIDVRSTIDIDLVGLGPKEAAQQLELMNLAESFQLPVDAVNQAAAFFLKKVGYQPEDLIDLVRGPSAVIFRPSLSLYIRLKAGRMSETDQTDCQHYIDFCKRVQDPIDFKEIVLTLRQAITSEKNLEKLRRLKLLESFLR